MLQIVSMLLKRYFGPFFSTQFLGAFNDNIFKNALIILIAYELDADSSKLWINIASGLFILPFFIFSGIAGQLIDKYEKSYSIKVIKFLEIFIMILAFFGFIYNQIFFLIFVLFLMGVQSTFFGPVKYSILPQILEDEELVSGNALVEMGTFIAILLGTIVGGYFISEFLNGPIIVAVCLIIIAILGYISSLSIPIAKSDSSVIVNYNFFKSTWDILVKSTNNRDIWIAIIAISWFWFFGFFFLAQFPSYAKNVLNGEKIIVTTLLTMFSIGIRVGSMIYPMISKTRLDLFWVPIAGLFLSVFSMDLFFASPGFTLEREPLSLTQFLTVYNNIRILFDLFMIGVWGGIYIVPLYTFIQLKGRAFGISRLIAALNVYNAGFMVFAAVLAICFIKIGISIPQMFAIISLLNLFFSIFLIAVFFKNKDNRNGCPCLKN